jgi:hypothetical protein
MATRLETLKTRLQQYIDCESAILSGAQSYAIGSRNLTRANLAEIAKMIKYLENEIAVEESKAAGKGRNRMFGVIPRDF